jgi:hypothetical protein
MANQNEKIGKATETPVPTAPPETPPAPAGYLSHEELERIYSSDPAFKPVLLKMRQEQIIIAGEKKNYAEKQVVITAFSEEKKSRYKINSDSHIQARKAWDEEVKKWPRTSLPQLSPLIQSFDKLEFAFNENERDGLQTMMLQSAFISQATKTLDFAAANPDKISSSVIADITRLASVAEKISSELNSLKAQLNAGKRKE